MTFLFYHIVNSIRNAHFSKAVKTYDYLGVANTYLLEYVK